MMGDSSLTRRRFLLATGTTAALAGCSEAPFGDEPPQRIPLHELPDVSERENSPPVVANDFPVDIGREWLTQTATRVTGLLESLSMPLGPEDVPNGYLRQNLQSALDARDPDTGGESGQLLPVAKRGEHAESARTYLDDSQYLYDRFRSFLPSDVGTVEPLLDAAAESLTAELQRRRDELPPKSAESSDEFAGRIQSRFRRHADPSAQNVPASGPARTVLAATEGLTDCLAYDRVRNRIEDRERFDVETGADVRTVRSEAVETIQTALEESPRPEPARGILADAATLVTYADDELARYRNSVRSTRLDDSVRGMSP